MTATGVSIRDALKEGAARLARSEVPDAQADAGWLLEHVVKFPRMLLPINREPMTVRQYARYTRLLEKRAARVPLQYLIGEVKFAGARIRVKPGVLIPRPETELLVKRCAAFIENLPRQPKQINALDLCSGSGAIGIALKMKFPRLEVLCSDVSGEACEETVANGRLNGVRMACVQCDMMEPFVITDRFKSHFDVIVCNPPYIPSAQIPSLQPEVLKEPIIALDGGPDGLDFYRRIAIDAPLLMKPHGALFLELGAGQADAVRGMMEPIFESVYIESDWNGIPRVIGAINPRGKHNHNVWI
ncbi:MAG: peptide chain release factor N(5)-glutamine methyltransferase [Oscillospiraceae bacterium]|jgi:release factor glutamine methyltransferase|nr:peptide chain release factor N(5)-glutamine methyltransferase [Oscillospiraceae bacterium]